MTSDSIDWVFLQVPSSQKKQRDQTIEFFWRLHCRLFLLLFVICRHGSTPVSTVLRKSVRFLIINIFVNNNSRTFQVEIWKMSVQMFSFSSFRALDRRNWGKGTSGSQNPKKFPGVHPGSPRSLLPRPLV